MTSRSLNDPVRSIFVMVLFFLLAQPLFCQTSTEDRSVGTKLKPVKVHFATLGGLQYSIEDELLVTDKQFEDLIYPLRDFETARMLKKSESSHLNSRIFGGVGAAGVLAGIVGLLTAPSGQQTPFWIAAVGGAFSIDIGGLFGSEAQTSKFNCVQRYNRFARGEEQILPQGPADERSLLDFSNEAPKKSSAAKSPNK